MRRINVYGIICDMACCSGYKSNNKVVYSSKYHVVWCPKYRRKVLEGAVAKRCKKLIRQTAAKHQAEVIAVEVMPDHVHLLVEVDPHSPIGQKHQGPIVASISAKSRSRLPTLWTNSYFVFTVGGSPRSVMKQYVENQKNV